MRVSHLSWNLAGLSLPLVIAAVTVPRLIEVLGHERFGLLALAWGLIGYAGALDLGIGRALTQRVSRLRGESNLASVPNVLATASTITLIAGVVGGLLIAIAALLGAGTLVNAATTPQDEIRISLLLLAVALPVQAMSSTYRGMNEAFMNFKGISLLRVALGIVNFGGPYLVAKFTTSLPWLVATLVISRMLALVVFYRLANACLREQGLSKRNSSYSGSIAKSLFAFGGWIALSSAISPMLQQADRFMIGTVISAASVTTYVLPYEVVVQSLILVGAVSSVFFPSLSKLIQAQPYGWERYFYRWLLRVGGMMFIVCSALALLLPFILQVWLGRELPRESIIVGRILCLGVLANSIGVMFYALLHAQGRADLTARLHMVELPLFVASLLFLLHRVGIEGAAWAWSGRMAFDAFALAWYARRIRRGQAEKIERGTPSLKKTNG